MSGAEEGTRVMNDEPEQDASEATETSEQKPLQILRAALEELPGVPDEESAVRHTRAIGRTLQDRLLGSRLASNNLLRLQNTLAASPAFRLSEQLQRSIINSVASTTSFRDLVEGGVVNTAAAALGRQAAGLGVGVTAPSFKNLVEGSVVSTTAAALGRQAAGLGVGVTAPSFKNLVEGSVVSTAAVAMGPAAGLGVAATVPTLKDLYLADGTITRGLGVAIPPMDSLIGRHGLSVADTIGAQLFRSSGIRIRDHAVYQHVFSELPVFDSIRDIAARLLRHVPGLPNRALIGARWARAAILRGDPDFEEIVDDFIWYWLEIRRITQAVHDGAIEALLEPWDHIAPGQLLKFLRDRTLQLAKLQQGLLGSRHQHQRQRYYVGSLDIPLLESGTTEGMRLASLNPTPEDLFVETQLSDPRLKALFTDLDPIEQRVAFLRHSAGWTWAEAAARYGQTPAYGESVRRKIKRRINCTPAIYGARP
ncbi:hypothetical protein [Nocardia barduliensis]|uniref:hypothetical protein n=1 Tax=Nocardia barduliensis TaxID=2736643 RepID=UPI0015728E6C|nr:hypothetical protein [Nocardia barduliensis]